MENPRNQGAWVSIGVLLLAVAYSVGCSSTEASTNNDNAGGAGTGVGGDSSNGGSGNGGSSATTGSGGAVNTALGGGTSSAAPVVGNFTVSLNPAIDASGPFLAFLGKVYTGPSLTAVLETPVAENADCKVYAFSQQSCTPACTTEQTCVGMNVCQANPTLVSVGAVSLTGIGGTTVKLVAPTKIYQYVGAEIAYPGFADGDTVELTAAGDFYPAFTVSTKGVAPIALSEPSYTLASGKELVVTWTPGSATVAADIVIGLNISKHGGSAGYLECHVEDTGALTIPANLVTALINLGVAGFPQLYVERSARGLATVASGAIELKVSSLANPTLAVEGYCSCFNSDECGTCSDKAKTVCDTVKKLCHAP